MTTAVKVKYCNFPVLVVTMNDGRPTERVVVQEKDGEMIFYATTTRSIMVQDLNPDDPRVAAYAIKTPETTKTVVKS